MGRSDSSPGAHATARHESTGHPLVRPMEPGREWAWCYADGLFPERMRGSAARIRRGPEHRPAAGFVTRAAPVSQGSVTNG